jgi:hypothetical protein
MRKVHTGVSIVATQTKTELKSSTALTDATIASLPTPKDYDAQAYRGFTDNEEGIKKIGAADQRVAFAIMCHDMFEAGNLTHRLVDATEFKDAADKRTYLLNQMRAHFIGSYPKPGKDMPTTDEMMQEQGRWDNKNALLKRAFNLAHHLTVNGVTFNQFNPKTGYFTVPGRGLAPHDDSSVIMMGRAQQAITLDNTTIVFTVTTTDSGGKKTTGSRVVRASASQYITANRKSVARTGRAAGSGASTTEAGSVATNVKKASVKQLADNVELDDMILAFRMKLLADDKEMPLNRGSISTAAWTAWKDLTVRMDEILTRDAPRAEPMRKSA